MERLAARRTELSPSEIAELRVLFPEVLRAHRGRVWAQLARRGLQPAEIEDLVQEVFLGLHVSLKKRGFPDNITALLYLIARRKLGNHLRKKKQQEPFSIGLPSSGSEPPRTPPDPERAVDRQVVPERLLSQLSSEERAILEAVEVDELTYEEAALALEIPLGTFKRRLVHAREKLAQLARQYQTPEGKAA
jgi:RNA polymerase sigma-70 factor (ECF subfamily)